MTNKIIFDTKEEYLTFVKFWKTLSTSKEATAQDHLIYALIKGMRLNRAFSEIKRKDKLTNNYSNDKYYTIKSLISTLSWAITYHDTKTDKNNYGVFTHGKWKDALPENIKDIIRNLVNSLQNTKSLDAFIEGDYSSLTPKIVTKPLTPEIKQPKSGLIKNLVNALTGKAI